MSPLEYVGERPEYKRRWDREKYRGVCACGASTWKRGERCATCERAGRTAAKEARWAELQRLWCEGRSLKEIASALGISVGCVGYHVAKMREAGWDVPYRHRGQYGKWAA